MAYRRTGKVSARLADNRRRILNSAREIVAEGGFSAAQMSEVARRAGVATGTLYRYFPSKEDLCRQVFREVSTREMNILANIASEDAPAMERLESVLRTFAGRAIQGRRLAYALLAEPVDVGLSEDRTRFRRTHAQVFAGILDDAIEAGDIPPINTQIAAACIAGAIPTALIGPLAPESHEIEDQSGARVLDDIVAFCMAAVHAAPGTAAQKNEKTEERRIAS
ncbi:AcrR family transcriptional regulator [Parvibaculum indicum]|uniref:TetR/AcrR family transcriptional regulator n=1 Tax=Parvibaculum indicum TaxID=562969 RepID=UPI00141E6148|nr:TetR/AcrR family transcriptional regulator [Parvibaculum indicum]NIJ41784.1 AcrR family transcriptional regulator [Parvibaculum indicum]